MFFNYSHIDSKCVDLIFNLILGHLKRIMEARHVWRHILLRFELSLQLLFNLV